VSALRGLWQYDIPRQSIKAFLIGLLVAIICGLIITFFWRASPSRVAEVEEVGQAEGRVQGTRHGQRDGLSAGRWAGQAEFVSQSANGSFAEGRELAVELAWNAAIETAIERAAHEPVIQLRRIEYWEALLR
jgi:hypothetical protein